MSLPLSAANTALVLSVLDRLAAIGVRPVLVGGLVPPLLVDALAPDADPVLPPRTTSDCDVAFVTDGERTGYDECTAALRDLGFAQHQQFRWRHASGQIVDAMPVPSGIERGEPSAVAFARSFVHHDPARFFRGYELALARPVTIELSIEGGPPRSTAVACVTAMLAMKLQAFDDRPQERPRDAHDIAWMARHLDAELIADDLHACRDTRPDLVDEIIERLASDFRDAWSRGTNAYFTVAYGRRTVTDEDEDARRDAAVRAIVALIDTYRCRHASR